MKIIDKVNTILNKEYTSYGSGMELKVRIEFVCNWKECDIRNRIYNVTRKYLELKLNTLKDKRSLVAKTLVPIKRIKFSKITQLNHAD